MVKLFNKFHKIDNKEENKKENNKLDDKFKSTGLEEKNEKSELTEEELEKYIDVATKSGREDEEFMKMHR